MTAGLNGHLAAHSLRKSFAQRLYEQTGDVFVVQEMLGHKSIATTQMGLLSGSLKDTPTETLLLELALRGYDLSKLRADTGFPDTPPKVAEVVKIG